MSTKSGSVESEYVLNRCGFKPKANRQIRDIAVGRIPVRSAIDRVDNMRVPVEKLMNVLAQLTAHFGPASHE